MDDLTVTKEQEIQKVFMGRRHVVLLGAGASRAAFPEGDRHGRRLPLMKDFADIVPVREIIEEAGGDTKLDFETTYSQIAADPGKKSYRARLEDVICEYFEFLRLPDSPTLYDHLVLSLRDKDIIATFNWDPFLLQAVNRSGLRPDQVPRLVFLHGNVAAGFCVRDSNLGVLGAACSDCGNLFEPMPLLYPIQQKDYERDPMIANCWERMERALQQAFMFTVFGYSAPDSDRSAVSLLKKAWGHWRDRQLEQVEIIDISPREELVERWDPFIHTHHYLVADNFYDSWIARHPRRSGEAYWDQNLEAKFIEDNPAPRGCGLTELLEWYRPLLEAEDTSTGSRRARG